MYHSHNASNRRFDRSDANHERAAGAREDPHRNRALEPWKAALAPVEDRSLISMQKRATQPEPPDAGHTRYSTDEFPPYRFVPGLLPHPTADPRGHSYGHVEPDLTAEARQLASDWRASPQFCYGVDLYNFAYWWEAHEAWEGLWRCFAEGDPLRHALQSLIQVSAAHLKRHVGQPRGVQALLRRAVHHVERARRAGPVVFGIALTSWFRGAVLPYFELSIDSPPEAGTNPTVRYPFLDPKPRPN